MNGINMELLTKIRDNRRKDRYMIQKLIDSHEFYSIKLNGVPIIDLHEATLDEVQKIKKNLRVAIVGDNDYETLIPLTLYCNYSGPVKVNDNGDISINNLDSPYIIAMSAELFDELKYDKPLEFRLYNIETKDSVPLLKITPDPIDMRVMYQEWNPYTHQKDKRYTGDIFKKIITPLIIKGYIWHFELYRYNKDFTPTYPVFITLGDVNNSYNINDNVYADRYCFKKNIKLDFDSRFEHYHFTKFD